MSRVDDSLIPERGAIVSCPRQRRFNWTDDRCWPGSGTRLLKARYRAEAREVWERTEKPGFLLDPGDADG